MSRGLIGSGSYSDNRNYPFLGATQLKVLFLKRLIYSVSTCTLYNDITAKKSFGPRVGPRLGSSLIFSGMYPYFENHWF